MAQKIQLVHCRYPKCSKLHETTELRKEDAVMGGGKNSYYHPDCYHTMQTINQIKDIFIKEINPLMTGQQIGMLVSTINNIVFSKNVEVDFLKFAVEYFIKYKSGALKYPAGLHYIIQDRDVATAWNNKKANILKNKLKTEIKNTFSGDNNKETSELNLDLDKSSFIYKPQKPRSFTDILH